ncbi:MAG: hypothetical protein LBV12_08725 [Puniceicoccales bacterium]|jgi:hypothetical protein|nr:hypothetical protein [Puniceicoccales bacterium]
MKNKTNIDRDIVPFKKYSVIFQCVSENRANCETCTPIVLGGTWPASSKEAAIRMAKAALGCARGEDPCRTQTKDCLCKLKEAHATEVSS